LKATGDLIMTAPAAPTVRIDPDLTLGEIALTVHNLDRTAHFYTVALGLTVLARDGSRAVLGTADGHPLVTLRQDAQAPTPPANATGLYHLAIAFPTRPDLARWLQHAAALGLQLGQSDHRTHEAFYFDDPEGNGIEVYHDWPREQWPFKDGQYTSFDNSAINIPGLISPLPANDTGWTGAPVGTRMGHVHLKMKSAAATRAFYEDVLGFTIGADGMGTVFAGAGGYHHHVGNNAWHSQGGPTPQKGALGLQHYTIELSSKVELEAVTARLKAAGSQVRPIPAGAFVQDPAGTQLLLRNAPSTVESALAALSVVGI